MEEDHRLPDDPNESNRRRCSVAECRQYEYRMHDGVFACHIHSPHCLQVGHTHEDPAQCERAHLHAPKLDVGVTVAVHSALLHPDHEKHMDAALAEHGPHAVLQAAKHIAGTSWPGAERAKEWHAKRAGAAG